MSDRSRLHRTRTTARRLTPTPVHLAAALVLWTAPPASATCLTPPGDVNGNGTTNVADAQCTFLGVLWQIEVDNGNSGVVAPACAFGGTSKLNLNCDAKITVQDAQLCVLLALGQSLAPQFDGNQNGCVDVCEAQNAICGNGITEIGEECDDGPGNSDTLADFCRTTCDLPDCGDAVVDTGEQCDDGNAASGDGCEANCALTGGTALALPYIQGFNSAGSTSYGAVNWTVESDTGSSTNNWTLATTGPLGGDRHGRFNAAPTVTSYTDRIISPLLNASAATFVTLSFDQAISLTALATSATQLRVLASNNGGSSWTPALTYGGNQGSLDAQRTVLDLSAVVAGSANARIAFEISGPTSAHIGYWEIDEIDVRVGAPPVVAPIADQSLAAGTSTQLTVSASDLDTPGAGLTFSLVGAPGFASVANLGNGTATLTLAPAANQTGTFNNVRLRVTDGTFVVDSFFDIFVAPGAGSTPAYVSIRSAASGGGAVVGDVSFSIGSAPLNLYCAAYNSVGAYLSDIPCTWTRTGTLPAPPPGLAAAIVYNPNTPGSGFITATPQSAGVVADSTGTITVAYPANLGVNLQTSTVDVSPSAIEATGTSTATVTVTAFNTLGQPFTGATVVINATAGTLTGAVTEIQPGVYQRTIQSSTTVGASSITATVNGTALTDSAILNFVSFFTISTPTTYDCDNYGQHQGKNLVVTSTLTINSNPTATNPLGCAPMEFGDVIIKTNGIVNHSATTAAQEFWMDVVFKSLIIEANGRIDVTGRGYLGAINNGVSGTWLGNTTVGGASVNTGGSHGGIGSASTAARVYGSMFDPRNLGAGGGRDSGAGVNGGAGGGAVRIKILDFATVNGFIRANGNNGGGAGAGGSISIETPSLGGSGFIEANGGTSSLGGGGGRVAIRGYSSLLGNFSTDNVATNVRAYGTSSSGAGTVFLKSTSMTHGWLIANNNNAAAPADSTPIGVVADGFVTLVDANTLTDYAPVWRENAYAGTWVNPNINQPGFSQGVATQELFQIQSNTEDTLTLQGNVDVDAIAPPGSTYRGVLLLDFLDIRGRAALFVPGDVLVLNGNGVSPVPGTFAITGRLNAERVDIQALTAVNVTNGAAIFDWIYSNTSAQTDLDWSLTGATLDTDFVWANTLTAASTSSILATNVDVASTLTATSTTITCSALTAHNATLTTATTNVSSIAVGNDLRIDGGTCNAGTLSADRDIVLLGAAVVTILGENVSATRKVDLQGTSRLHHELIAVGGPLERLNIVTQSLLVGTTAGIDVSGRGFSGSANSAAAYSIGNSQEFGAPQNVGGSHGGIGGGSNIDRVFGTPFEPMHAGGGGGRNSTDGVAGLRGGGVVRIQASALVRVDGFIRANGAGGNAGCGAGGSIWITTTQLAGSGSMQANAGTGAFAGSGGRIAVRGFVQRTGSFGGAGVVTAIEARGTSTAGAGTIFLQQAGQPYGELIVDNEGTDAPKGSTPILVVPQGTVGSLSGSQFTNGGAGWTPDRYKGSWVNPNLGQNGTNAPLGNDEFFYITGHDFSTASVSGSVPLGSVAQAGDTFRGVLPLDRLEVRGRASISVDGDVFVKSGGVTSTDPTVLALGGEVIANRIDFNNVSRIDASGGGVEANVVFTQGDDNFPLDITLASSSILNLPNLNAGSLTSTSSTINIPGNMTVNGNLSLTSTTTTAGDVSVTGSAVLKTSTVTLGDLSANSIEIDGGTTTLDRLIAATTAVLKGTSATVTVRDELVQANTLQLLGSAKLHHCETDSTKECRLFVNVQSLLIETNAMIDVSARGYTGSANSAAAFSKGNIQAIGAPQNNAGNHGGMGTGTAPSAARVYGSVTDPVLPGGGGGRESSVGQAGGDGGGAVRIVASQFAAIDGKILANGGTGGAGGGGAGGSVNLTTLSLGGNGEIQANGANTSFDGGGGRVALKGMQTVSGSFTTPALFTKVQAKGGGPGAGAGTIFVQRQGQAYGDLIVDNQNVDAGVNTTPIPMVPQRFVTGVDPLANSLLDVVAAWEPNAYLGTRINPNIAQPGSAQGLTNQQLFLVLSNSEEELVLAGAVPIETIADLNDAYRGVLVVDNLEIRGRASVSVPGDVLVWSGDVASSNATTLAMSGRLNAMTVDLNEVSAVSLQQYGGIDADKLFVEGALDSPVAWSIAANAVLDIPALHATTLTTTGGTITAGSLTAAGPVQLANTTVTTGDISAAQTFTAVSCVFTAGVVEAGSTLTIQSGTATVDELHAAANIELLGNAAVTVNEAAVQTQQILRLRDTAQLFSCETSAGQECGLDIDAVSVVLFPSTRINVDGRGYTGQVSSAELAYSQGNTPTGATTNIGGSHGGRGGSAPVAAVFDNFTNPQYPGGGGGRTAAGPGGDGGGVVLIDATTSVIVDGEIRANGTTNSGCAGAGGTIRIRTPNLGGSGKLLANGANSPSPGGGSSGGRIAILDYVSLGDGFAPALLPNNVEAAGGSGTTGGGAGTIFLRSTTDTYGSLLVDNKNLSSTAADSTPILVLPEGPVIGFTSTPNKTITDFSLGAPPNRYVGTWVNPNITQPGAQNGVTTQTIFQVQAHTPTVLTLAGTGSMSVTGIGKTYRGVLALDRLTVRRRADVKVDGEVLVTSGNLDPSGSAWVLDGTFEAPVLDLGGQTALQLSSGALQVGQLIGSQDPDFAFDLTLAGSNTTYTETNTYVNQLTVGSTTTLNTGSLSVDGDADVAGVVNANEVIVAGVLSLTGSTGSSLGNVLVDELSMDGGSATVANLSVVGNATLLGAAQLTAEEGVVEVGGTLSLNNTSRLFPGETTATTTTKLDVSADVVSVATGCEISALGRGYLGAVTAGTAYHWGNTTAGAAGTDVGGAHGGRGLTQANNAVGSNTAYDSIFDPTFPGGGGGFGNPGTGGDGGGVIHIDATSGLVVNGVITADGAPGASGAAGGAGGSVRITTGSLSGSGTITARGGAGSSSGNGGGGRIAVLGPQVFEGNFAFNTIWTGLKAEGGGVVSTRAGAGTIFVLPNGAAWGTLIIDNASATNATANTTTLVALTGGTIQSLPANNTILDASANFLENTFVGSYLNPDVAQGLANRRVDDTIFPIVANGIQTVTADSNISSIAAAGKTYRGIIRVNNLEIRGGARVSMPGDIVVLEGDLHSGNTTTFELVSGTTLTVNVLDLNTGAKTGAGTVTGTVVP